MFGASSDGKFTYENLTIEILKVDEFIVEKVKVIVNNDDEDEDEEE